MSQAVQRSFPARFVSRFEDHPATVFDAAYAATDVYASYAVEGGGKKQQKARPARQPTGVELPALMDFSPLEKAFFAAGDELSEENATTASVEPVAQPKQRSARVGGNRRRIAAVI